MTRILRGQVIHVPRDPFAEADALEAFSDGAVAVDDGHVVAVGDFAAVRGAHADAEVDGGDAVILPGFVDTHVHYPQVPIIGAMGLRLLDWLQTRTLPEEARLADTDYAREVARVFVRALAANGTTSALVFGSHFPGAQDALFAEAERVGLRITSGLVVSDRELLPALHRDAQAAYQASSELIGAWHNRGRLRYAVTPRFSLSCTEAILDACRALLAETDDLFFTSHLNENPDEIAYVAQLFPQARDYLDTYDRFDLVGPRSVFAHDVHVTDAELRRMADARCVVAHCPSSNAFLGSGLFAMRRHLQHGVRFALGTDVGAGTGFSIFKEALMAYHAQMVRPEGELLSPAHLLYLATRAGADALGLADTVGDLSPGNSADLVVVRPPAGSTLEAVLAHSPSPQDTLGALFTLAREDCVAQVLVAGQPVIDRLAP